MLYEKQVREAYFEDNPSRDYDSSPIQIDIAAAFKLPSSWSKTKKAAALAGTIKPGKPDVDNIAKIIQDALNRVAYRDDAQVYRCTVTKCYTDGEPHTDVRITYGIN